MRLIDADAFFERNIREGIYDTSDLKEMLEREPTVDRWIPVTARLPEPNTKVRVTGKAYNQFMQIYYYAQFMAIYIPKFTIKSENFWCYIDNEYNEYNEDYVENNEADDCYYVKEGWYETSSNNDDCALCYANFFTPIAWKSLEENYKG